MCKVGQAVYVVVALVVVASLRSKTGLVQRIMRGLESGPGVAWRRGGWADLYAADDLCPLGFELCRVALVRLLLALDIQNEPKVSGVCNVTHGFQDSAQYVALGEALGEPDEPPLGGVFNWPAASTATGDVMEGIRNGLRGTYVFQTRALVVLQETVLRAEVAVTESTVSDNPLRGGPALLECAARLDGHGGG